MVSYSLTSKRQTEDEDELTTPAEGGRDSRHGGGNV